ncbi:MAG: hypothetical protein IKW28_08925 [Lachnospiraceae bacterium]|nr:hypothetical protein [Lachnospiraceae bacterium]
MEKKRSFIFTNKRHTRRGIMSSILGIISLVSLVIAVYQTYQAAGQAGDNLGLVGFVSLVFAITGIGLGYFGRLEQDRFRLFAYLGLVLNFLVLAAISFILYAGAYGL